MPRPKGSKNKKKAVVVVENVDERIAAAEAEIASLTEQLKAKKAELKDLNKAKAEADRLAALQKAEAEQAKLLEAVAASGKSIEEIINSYNELHPEQPVTVEGIPPYAEMVSKGVGAFLHAPEHEPFSN